MAICQGKGLSGSQGQNYSEDLRRILDEALGSANGFFIEAILRKEDHAPIMQRISDYALSGGRIR